MELHLTVTQKWFNLIASDIKKEEYRELKEYWIRRLLKEFYYDLDAHYPWQIGTYEPKYPFSTVLFKNGYQPDSPFCKVEFIGLQIKTPNPLWIDPSVSQELRFAILLGEIIDIKR